MLYVPPNNRDMAVCLVIFRPVAWKSTQRNFLRVLAELNAASFPTFIAELVLTNEQPITAEFTDEQRYKNNVHLFASDHVLFHKENLQNLLAAKIPATYRKLCFIDADILFTDPNWYARTSQLLDNYDIVQPMDWCEWLDKDNERICCENMYGKIPAGMLLHLQAQMYIDRCHTGFAWAFKRDAFERINGFYDRCPAGGGDSAFVYALAKDDTQLIQNMTKFAVRECAFATTGSYQKYREQVQAANFKISYLPDNTSRHLWHGAISNRGYGDQKIANKQTEERYYRSPPINVITNEYPLILRQDGLLEWDDERFSRVLLPYFIGRNDDE